MKTVRQRIYDFIQSRRTTTANEISQIFKMTKSNARYHLSILKQQGVIQGLEHRPLPGKGRPEQVYTLSRQLLGDNLETLASALLEQIRANSTMDAASDPYKEIASSMARKMSVEDQDDFADGLLSRNLTGRLNRLTQLLNQYHYSSRWEARRGSPWLFFNNCPYVKIIADHPELCHLDALLIGILLELRVEQIARLELDTTGSRHCIFCLSEKQV